MTMPPLQPMLPVSEPVLPGEEGFIHEIKWDGYRVLAHLQAGKVNLQSRNGRYLNRYFPQLVEELGERGLEAILDGEVVALTKEGRVDFSLLRSSQGSTASICYIVFDLLYLHGEDFCPRPWLERRRQLENLISDQGSVLLSPLLPGSAADALAFIRENQLEGIVSKSRDSPYLPGTRSPYWRKQRVKKSLDCILVGAKIEGSSIRSIAVALYTADGSLFYLGNVGSGLTQRDRDFLRQAEGMLVEGSGKHQCPCLNPPLNSISWIWYRPLVVVEVEYFELTQAKRLRHPVFKYFRFDKAPKDCILEANFDDH